MMIYELDDIEKEVLLGKVVERARADLNDGRPLTEMRRGNQVATEKKNIAILYGVGGSVYTFIHQARNDYNKQGQIGMSHRAQELLEEISEHDKAVAEIARQVTAECKAELASNAPTMTESERNDLARAIAESDITDGQLENADIDALVDLFEAWLERRSVSQ